MWLSVTLTTPPRASSKGFIFLRKIIRDVIYKILQSLVLVSLSSLKKNCQKVVLNIHLHNKPNS